jgi:hypothetical protein
MQTQTGVIVDLISINDSFPNLSDELISRDNYLDLIEKKLEYHDVLFLKGESGVGKTSILASFARDKSFQVISHFVMPSYLYSYSPDFVKRNLAKQILFYSSQEIDDDIETDDTFSNLQIRLLRKIRLDKKNRRSLYFIFDGFGELEKNDLDSLQSLILNLPFKSAKFIFSCSEDDIEHFLPRGISRTSLDVTNFTIIETEYFLNDLTTNKEQCREIYNLAHKGLPEKLAQIKRLCKIANGVELFLTTVDRNTDLFEIEWGIVTEDDELLIALIAFNNENFEIDVICEILKISDNALKGIISRIEFIEISDNKLNFLSNSHRKFAKEKLSTYEEKVWTIIIEYYEKNISKTDSIYNLPNLYHKAKKWNELTKLLSLDAFICFVEKYQSINNVKRQIDYGLEAAKNLNSDNKFIGDILKFALHKSSFLEMEKYEMWESEVEARIVLGRYEEAVILANKVLLKEDKLKMLAIIAKQLKLLSRPIDSSLTDQIIELYAQVDFTHIKNKAIEIASYFIYFNFDLAIELLEKVLDNNTNNNVDFAFAYLSLFAYSANKNANSKIVDVDLLNSKIKDSKAKSLTEALDFLSDELSVYEIIEKARKLDNISRRMFLLRYWISNNKNKPDIENVIEYALNEIITASDEHIPNASTIADIGSPLPYLKDYSKLEQLIKLFDSQKNTITTPTRDFVKLRLLIAEALSNFDKEKTSERIFEIWYFVDEEISDLSIKTDCLALLWNKLLIIDIDNSIEKYIYPDSCIENQIHENVLKLLEKTAFHFRMVDFIIKTIVHKRPDFVISIVQLLNTLERRESGFKLAAIQYINKNIVEDIDFNIFAKFYTNIKAVENKNEVLISLVDKFELLEDENLSIIKEILKYRDEFSNFSNVGNKCYVFTKILKILYNDSANYKELINEIYNELKLNWDTIDNQVKKIEIGYLITKDIASFDNDKALEFLNATSKFKENEPFASSSIMDTYILNAELLIKSFEGAIINKTTIINELKKIEEIFELIQSAGERAKLWCKVALVLRSNSFSNEFSSIVKDKIEPIMELINSQDRNYQIHIYTIIAPCIFLYSESTFFNQINYFPIESKDEIINNVCNYIFTKKTIGEPTENTEKGVELTFAEYNQLIALLEFASNDYMIFHQVKRSAINLLKNWGKKITGEQRNSIVLGLDKLIDKKLPNSEIGIEHKGYWIVSKATLLIFEDYNRNKSKWNDLIKQIKLVPNISDKALVLIIISELLPERTKKQIKIDLLEEAFELIKCIPSNYDKTNRFDATWDVWLGIGKGEFCKHMKIAYNDLLCNHDGTLNNLRDLIDVAHQHDTRLAEDLITLLDQDPARKRLKEPLLKRLASNNKIKKASKELLNLKELSPVEYMEVFNRNLAHLHSGKLSSLTIEKTYNILEVSSKTPLSVAFPSLSFFIQNETNRMRQDSNLLISFFEATYQNAKLIATFSADNIEKMKNLFKYANPEQQPKNQIFRYGENDKLFRYLGDWIYKNVNEEIIYIDPYFDKNELELLKLISQLKPDCFITILSSRKSSSNNNEDELKIQYESAWKKISINDPPQNRIIIVWDLNSNDCPFHDRWLLSDKCTKGLILNSLNSNGFKRDTQINELEESALKNVENTVVLDYIYRKRNRIFGFNLKYFDFSIIK